MKGFENRRYINYTYIGGGDPGIQGFVRIDNEKITLEPINPNIYEGFINTYTLYDICAIFEDIQNELGEIYAKGVWRLSDSPWVMHKHYLQLLVKHKISHLSICMHDSLYVNSLYINSQYGDFICRLDCLDDKQFQYIIQLLKEELSVTEHATYKLCELPRFKWEGV